MINSSVFSSMATTGYLTQMSSSLEQKKLDFFRPLPNNLKKEGKNPHSAVELCFRQFKDFILNPLIKVKAEGKRV